MAAKKKETVAPPLRSDRLPELSEERRKELFPNSPPPTLKQLLEAKKNKSNEKN
jgi:hypothetical protein